MWKNNTSNSITSKKRSVEIPAADRFSITKKMGTKEYAKDNLASHKPGPGEYLAQ